MYTRDPKGLGSYASMNFHILMSFKASSFKVCMFNLPSSHTKVTFSYLGVSSTNGLWKESRDEAISEPIVECEKEEVQKSSTIGASSPTKSVLWRILVESASTNKGTLALNAAIAKRCVPVLLIKEPLGKIESAPTTQASTELITSAIAASGISITVLIALGGS